MVLKSPIPASINPVLAFGVHDSNLRLLERLLDVKTIPTDTELILEGEDSAVSRASSVMQQIYNLSKGNMPVSHNEIRILIEESLSNKSFNQDSLSTEGLITSKKGHRLKPRSKRQADYIRNIFNHDLVFSFGPAGTGKTFLAVAAALHLLQTGRIRRIILTRPVVEAGENLGFLPGTLEEKIDPYLRPLFDAMNDLMPPDEVKNYIENQVIELAPLAYMRGRTLANAFVILDEAQNTTTTQMKMFLTRLGENSKMVVTGDITQIDLPYGKESGLKQAFDLFGDVEGIAFSVFEQADVVRHGLVKRIIEIYERRENEPWTELSVR